ncbi:DNA ligase D [Tianweitania sp. BSSL-BM11]|uniref:DNA ligase (ATP) n=1 Tax=Tianweitania aestuarii TaxID=2814886 RepID=A0ABS5RXN0_9HYPH|nr:DNA ligase D [Tianweitania aestuarii]
MALEDYNKKRNFEQTAEPRGKISKAKSAKTGNSFCIQKHDATRLHYDFRLELDGVLKSWAVTRGPSLDTSEKRLAVQTEDHPLDYGDFEGTIPKGEYGGGTVLLWDRGTWKPTYDPHKGLAKGHLEFELEGDKLSGRWHLVKMPRRAREKRDNWLLIKADDDVARSGNEGDILEQRPESVKTGRSLDEIAREAPGWSSKTGKLPAKSPKEPQKDTPNRRKKAPAKRASASAIKGAKPSDLPDFIPPGLATLVAKAPGGKRWIHEIKFDGYRLQAHVSHREIRLLTRTGLDWTKKFGTAVADAFAALPLETALIDGELVVETQSGTSDFSALQSDLSEGRSDRFIYYAFDIMHLDGQDLTGARLLDRKAELERIVGPEGTVRYSSHFTVEGEVMKAHACKLNLEGVISKIADDPYPAGRSKSWLKSKCSSRQEFVICGYVPSTVDKKMIGSLVLGVHENGALQHIGRVGTGYSRKVAADLYKRLNSIEISKSPFPEKLPAEARRDVVFVEPELVAEIEFRGWTGDHNLRHASFRGLREDKPAAEVVREEPVAAVSASKTTTSAEVATLPTSVKLTHPERIYWPDEGVTKEGLANYYADVWRSMAPFVINRPLALLRCPGGITGQSFFQKHIWRGANKAIKRFKDPKDGPDEEPLVMIDGLDGLIGLVQAGALEIHPWGSTIEALEKPDTIIMDLDPGEGVTWDRICDGAREIKARFEAVGMAAFVKTSGGKGLHVVSPLTPKADWATVKAFTKQMAEAMAADSPDDYVSVITKSKRNNKILVDYLRNGRNATAVAAYSSRARPGAAVSMPIEWDDLGPQINPAGFTVENAPAHVANRKRDPWGDFLSAAVPLPATKPKTRKR